MSEADSNPQCSEEMGEKLESNNDNNSNNSGLLGFQGPGSPECMEFSQGSVDYYPWFSPSTLLVAKQSSCSCKI